MSTVLLVEDDALVRRFVAMALDGMAVNLVEQCSIAGALAWLGTGRADLVLTDLSLSDGSGLELLRWLARNTQCRVAVFSAGVTPLVAREIERIGVWRVLHKPVSLAQLQTCVLEGTAPAPDVRASEDVLGGNGDVVQRFFGGDRALFDNYCAACRTQFARDMKAGDDALRLEDLQALSRLGHSLHTVLQMLGHPAEAHQARALERAAGMGRASETHAQWALLSGALSRLST